MNGKDSIAFNLIGSTSPYDTLKMIHLAPIRASENTTIFTHYLPIQSVRN